MKHTHKKKSEKVRNASNNKSSTDIEIFSLPSMWRLYSRAICRRTSSCPFSVHETKTKRARWDVNREGRERNKWRQIERERGNMMEKRQKWRSEEKIVLNQIPWIGFKIWKKKKDVFPIWIIYKSCASQNSQFHLHIPATPSFLDHSSLTPEWSNFHKTLIFFTLASTRVSAREARSTSMRRESLTIVYRWRDKKKKKVSIFVVQFENRFFFFFFPLDFLVFEQKSVAIDTIHDQMFIL